MLNKITIIGNLGADLEVRFTPAGKQTSTFSVATTEKWKDKDGHDNPHKEPPFPDQSGDDVQF